MLSFCALDLSLPQGELGQAHRAVSLLSLSLHYPFSFDPRLMGHLKHSVGGMAFVPLLVSREVEHLLGWAQVYDPVWLLASSRWKLNLTPSHSQLP